MKVHATMIRKVEGLIKKHKKTKAPGVINLRWGCFAFRNEALLETNVWLNILQLSLVRRHKFSGVQYTWGAFFELKIAKIF